MPNNKNSNNVLFPAGVILGALVGTAMGVLFAPQEGKETRKKLKEVTDKLKIELEKRLSETKELTEESYKKIVDKVVEEYGKNEPLIKENAKKIKESLKGTLKLK